MTLKPLRLWAAALILTGCTTHTPTMPAPEDTAPAVPTGPIVAPPRPYVAPEAASPQSLSCLHDMSGTGLSGQGAQRVLFTFNALVLAEPTGKDPVGTIEVRAIESGRVFTGAIFDVRPSDQGYTLSGTLSEPAGAPFTVALPARDRLATPDRFIFATEDEGTLKAFGGVEPIEGQIAFGMCGEL